MSSAGLRVPRLARRAAPRTSRPEKIATPRWRRRAHWRRRLPADDLSRYFAERNLQQAMVEAGNGEFDDCLEMAERATDEVQGAPP